MNQEHVAIISADIVTKKIGYIAVLLIEINRMVKSGKITEYSYPCLMELADNIEDLINDKSVKLQ